VDPEKGGRVRSRLPSSGDHSNDFSLLLIIQLWRPTSKPPFSASGLQTDFCAFPQHRAFELGKRSNHLHHHAPCRRGRVRSLSPYQSGQAELPVQCNPTLSGPERHSRGCRYEPQWLVLLQMRLE
jgi:hypothetical protein